MLVATGANGAATLDTRGTTLLVISLIIGILVGQAIDIEGRLDTFATWLHTHVSRTSSRKKRLDQKRRRGPIQRGICHGIAHQSAPARSPSSEGSTTAWGTTRPCFVKAVLDFVIVFTLAASLGIGVAFSAVPLFRFIRASSA